MRFQLYSTQSSPPAPAAVHAIAKLAEAKGLKVVAQRRGRVIIEADSAVVAQLSPLAPGWDIDPIQRSVVDSPFESSLQYHLARAK